MPSPQASIKRTLLLTGGYAFCFSAAKLNPAILCLLPSAISFLTATLLLSYSRSTQLIFVAAFISGLLGTIALAAFSPPSEPIYMTSTDYQRLLIFEAIRWSFCLLILPSLVLPGAFWLHNRSQAVAA